VSDLPHGRIHNFSAGPAALPLEVLEELPPGLMNLGGGVGILEMSHRGATFDAILRRAEALMKKLLGLPDDYEVLFLQGGASLQFLMLPMNLLQGGSADYLGTGAWASKAVKEAAHSGKPRLAWDGASEGYRRCPTSWDADPDAVYTHFTSNNTIAGTQYATVPDVAGRLVCDASSDILCRAWDWKRCDVIYAGAQKNLGPSGVTIVVLSPWAQERARAVQKQVPTQLSYSNHIDKDGLLNTPNSWGVWVAERVLCWIERQGLEAVEAANQRKADTLYALLDGSDFFRPHADVASRSLMNVTWRLADPALEPVMVQESLAAGLSGLKGHRSVGGLRASIYNAVTQDAVDALVDFLRHFEKTHG